MKTKAWMFAAMLSVMAAYGATNDLTGLLQKGLFEEEANRDLSAAISNYQTLANAFDKDRQMAATAIFRLGECYRKLGKTNEAVVQYERIIREFGDQQTMATLSRQNLAGLAVPENPDVINRTQQLEQSRVAAEARLAENQMLLKTLKSTSRGELRKSLPAIIPDAQLDALESQLTSAQQELTRMGADYSSENPKYKTAEVLVKQLEMKVNDRIDGILVGLQAKVDANAAYLEALKAQMQTTGVNLDQPTSTKNFRSENVSITDEEEKEIRRIQVMIQNSPDLINAPSGDPKMTPLYRAATNGWLRVAAYLLDHGANIETAFNGDMPLHGATRSANKGMVEFLLAHGADVNAMSYRGSGTALHIAVEKGFSAVAQTLIAHGANVNASSSSYNANRSQTPLHTAAVNDRVEMIQSLLAHGADINSKGENDSTPLMVAAQRQNRGALKALLAAKADVNTVDVYGQTPLIIAVGKSDSDAAKMLLDAKADPNGGRTNLPLATAIEYAYSQYRSNLCTLLLQNGADPNKVAPVRLNNEPVVLNSFHQRHQNEIVNLSPIQLAVIRNDTDLVRLLLDYKADARARGANRATLLLEAAELSNDRMAGALIDHGAEVNAHGSYGETALHLAASAGNRKLMELLLAHKADVNAQNNDGQTPLDWIKNYSLQGAPGGIVVASGSLSIPGAAGAESSTESTPIDLAGLLRQHGALDTLPNFSVIRVMREGYPGTRVVFMQASNNWNQMTLLETIYNYYYDVQLSNAGRFARSSSDAIRIRENNETLPFPDLARITVHRPSRSSSGKDKDITINLLNGTNGVDCAKDLPLEFGDVVEIPFREHALSDSESRLRAEHTIDIRNCLQQQASIVVRGQSRSIELFPNRYLSFELQLPEARAALLSSSDLTRVKVTRKNPATGKSQEFVVDATRIAPQQDFWLHEGDVIEVPEK